MLSVADCLTSADPKSVTVCYGSQSHAACHSDAFRWMLKIQPVLNPAGQSP